MTLYNALIHKLPQENQNIKSILLKLTMGKPVEVK
jgi:ribosomal protein L1